MSRASQRAIAEIKQWEKESNNAIDTARKNCSKAIDKQHGEITKEIATLTSRHEELLKSRNMAAALMTQYKQKQDGCQLSGSEMERIMEEYVENTSLTKVKQIKVMGPKTL